MYAYCEGPTTSTLIELDEITKNRHEYSYIKIERAGWFSVR